MRRLCFSALLVGAACGYLDDRASRRTAEKVHGLIRPGMKIDEIIIVTEPIVGRTVWALSAEDCEGTSNIWGVRSSGQDGGYIVETFTRDGDQVRNTDRKHFGTRGRLLEALAEKPLGTCRDFGLGVGQWSVPFRVDSSGRVESVSRPAFTD